MEQLFRRSVCALARPIPLSSPYWTAAMTVLPSAFGFSVIRGSVRSLAGNTLVGSFFSVRSLFVIESAIIAILVFLSLSFLARLLQICDPLYFDPYRIEEGR